MGNCQELYSIVTGYGVKIKVSNGNPNNLKQRVVNPERIYVLAPEEPFTLKRFKN